MGDRFYEEQQEAAKAMRDSATLHRLGAVSDMPVKDLDVEGLIGVSFYLRGYEVFIVAKGVDGEGVKFVAFDQSDTFEKAVLKTLVKAAYGGFKWKVDKKSGG